MKVLTQSRLILFRSFFELGLNSRVNENCAETRIKLKCVVFRVIRIFSINRNRSMPNDLLLILISHFKNWLNYTTILRRFFLKIGKMMGDARPSSVSSSSKSIFEEVVGINWDETSIKEGHGLEFWFAFGSFETKSCESLNVEFLDFVDLLDSK